jgi:hypothetical protein
MSIHAVCECGKKFEAKDEYEGRRAICPSCKREFVFQRGGIPVFQEVVEPRPQPTIQIDDDALPGVITLKVTPAAKTRWRGSIAMTPRTIAAVVSVTVLGCLAVSYYRATQPAKDPPGLKRAKAFFESQVAQINANSEFGALGAKVEFVLVDAIKDDPRKLPWLCRTASGQKKARKFCSTSRIQWPEALIFQQKSSRKSLRRRIDHCGSQSLQPPSTSGVNQRKRGRQ